MKQAGIRIGTHAIALALGFALGIYALPILTAERGASETELRPVADRALYTGRFERSLTRGDPLHWTDGKLSVTRAALAFEGASRRGPTTSSISCRGSSRRRRRFSRRSRMRGASAS
ncbi:hypothetical protein BMMON2_01300 [Burkholderia mallei]